MTSITEKDEWLWENFIKPRVDSIIANRVFSNPLFKIIGKIVNIYEDGCNVNQTFNCSSLVIYNGVIYESLIDENDRHPHDTSAWLETGSISDILKSISKPTQSALVVPYHVGCPLGGNCTVTYGKGDYVALKVETGEFDDCGKPIYEDVYYISLDSDNVNPLSSDSWYGPMSVSDMLSNNSFTQNNGNTIFLATCFKRLEDGLNEKGFLKVVNNDLESAQWLLIDSTVVTKDTHKVNNDCCC